MIKTELIEKYIQNNNLSKTKFCQMCEISPSTLKRIMSNSNFRLNALFKIAKVLNVAVYEMVN